MRAFVLALCGVWLAAGTAAAAALPPRLEGEWVGERNGNTVIWTLEGGRLRIDGRGADYAVHGDTLMVEFDPPAGETAPAPRETAVYHIAPDDTSTRLFVYGFDLGKQGVLLYRAEPEESNPVEDAAPALPPTSGRP